MAPALTPRRPGQRIKTDRRDAVKLVRLFRAGELTPIRVPNEAEEAVRDLVRCREDCRRDVLRWRHRLLKFLDRHGRLYVTGRNWSQRHWTWIRNQHFDLPILQRTFEATLFALEQALARVAELDKEIAAVADKEPYRIPVGWLRCFRGIDTLSAMILLAEIVDFQRFNHPRELMGYLGLVPSEYSSGDTQRRGAITKAGNTHARRALVEAAWHYRHRPSVAGALRQRTEGQPPHVVGFGLARPATLASTLPPSRRPRQAPAGRRGRRRTRTGRLSLGRHDAPDERRVATGEGGHEAHASMFSFLRNGDASVVRARLESPRASYATPAVASGTTRAPRWRPLPTNHGHAARPFGATRVYQPDSSSKTPHPPLRGAALRNSSLPRINAKGSDPPKNVLDGRSFHIS